MNLRERLQELIGKNPGGCEEHSVVPGMLCLHGDCINARAINHHKALQRKQVEQSAATIAADLKRMLPELLEVPDDLPDWDQNRHIGHNEAVEQIFAAIDRYCGVEATE